MVLTAYYSYKAAELNWKVAEWLERHGVDVDALSDGSRCGFEELMYGRNIADELCERIEREAALRILHWKRKPRRSLTDAAPPAVHLWTAAKRQNISIARCAGGNFGGINDWLHQRQGRLRAL